MAGMLPGVEYARRRRLHQHTDSYASTAYGGSTRRSSFCLYTSSHETSHTSASSLERSILNNEDYDGKLGGAASQAKERLDERLRAQRKTSSRRYSRRGRVRGAAEDGELQMGRFGLKCKIKMFNWAKLNRP